MKITEINSPELVDKRLRVCAYARVSDDDDGMLNSLSNQVSYYNEFISSNPKWIFAGVYADFGLSGTKDTRPEFQRMISDCKAGKIDLIIAKSISRFSRNTAHLLGTVRMLDEIGVDVFFEEQNLNIKSAEGELMLTIYASIAQEEARQVSENIKWRIKKNFENGVMWGGGNPYGYTIDWVNKTLIVNPEQADVVRMIVDLYISGKGAQDIANILNAKNIKTMNNCDWGKNSVFAVLRNEIYTGDRILQKTYKENYLSKKTIRNNGELQRYYVEDHEPIITHEIFERATQIRNERATKFKAHESHSDVRYPFTSIIKCSCCGATFQHKVTRYSKLWICKTYNTKGKAFCMESKQIDDGRLRDAISEFFGWDDFNETKFKAKVNHIIAKPNNELELHLNDGTVESIHWKDRSRSESWTPEMREKVRQKTVEQNKKRGVGGKWAK